MEGRCLGDGKLDWMHDFAPFHILQIQGGGEREKVGICVSFPGLTMSPILFGLTHLQSL